MGKKPFSIVFLSLILLSSTVLYSIPSAYANGEPANLALGQPNLVLASSTVSSITLNAPHAAVTDASGNVWVADTNNNRVLRYSSGFANGQSADLVLGQADLTSNAINSGGISASSLSSPRGLAIDGSGNVWVADSGNNRVLRFDAPITNFKSASVVVGQSSFTGTAINSGGISASSLSSPRGLAIDGSGNVWVADSNNNRVLKFNSPSLSTGEAADLVLGQGVFTTSSSGLSDTALKTPNGVRVDGSGNVWVADTENNRVLKFNTPAGNGEQADMVLGQPNFVSNAPNNLSVTALTLNKPQDITIVGSDVWVADGSNNRLLRYNSPASATGEAADVVLGQSDFTTGDPNFGGLSGARLFSPQSVMIDGSGNLWTADSANNRVLRYSTLTTGQSAGLVLGQPNFTSSTSGAGSLSASTLILPRGVITDQLGNTWVADTANNRVLRFSPGFSNGQNADVVLGQADFTSNAVGFDSQSLASPRDLGIDHEGNLWVADTGNSRVVRFNDGDANPATSNFANGQTANFVLGQANFVTNLPNRGGSAALDTMSFPAGILVVFVDEMGSLAVAVADTGNNRVLAFFGPSTNGESAGLALGGSGSASATTMSGPTDVALASPGLWVSDTGNNRILRFNLEQGIAAVDVLGQADFTSNSPNAFGNSGRSLSSPRGLSSDADSNLWADDSNNHRTLLFAASASTGDSAIGVLGQPDLVSNVPNNGGVSATSQSSPSGVAVDSNGDLWVADTSNNRVLRYQQLPEAPQEPDTDGDGVPDSEDNCPDNAGPAQNNGCPQQGPPPDSSEILNAIDSAKQMIMDVLSTILQTVTNIALNVDDIQNTVNNPEFGLEEIKNEVRNIESEVTGSSQALANLQTTLNNLETSVNDPDFGLEEIKNEVRNIESEVTGSSQALANLQTTLNNLETSVNDPDFGLEEIKNEVRNIETNVLATTVQITSIQQRLDLLVAIQDKLDELQAQLDDIRDGLGGVDITQRVEISVSRSDGSDEYVVLTTLSGVPVDASFDRILVLNNQAQVTVLAAGQFTVTDLDTGLSLLEIDNNAVRGGIRAVELVVSFTDGGTTSHGAILFEDNVDKNTAQ